MEYNCRGGPMQSKLLMRREGRGRLGVLLVDRPNNRCWVYDWDASSQTFACREERGRTLDEARLILTADQDDFDVIAAPWIE